MSLKKSLHLLAALLVAAGVAFAGGQKDAEGTQAESGAEDVELRFTVWSGSDQHHATLNAIADSYTEEHPNVSIQFDTIPFDEYVTKLTLQLSGSNPPDGGWLLETSAPTFIDSGVLADVGSYLRDNQEYDYADFSKPAMQLWVDGESVYGVPFSTSPFVVFYNADAFREAGVPTPNEALESGNWTWERFAEMARTIKSETGLYAFETFGGAGYDTRLLHTIVPILRAYGTDMWNENGELLLDSPEAVEAMELYHDMIYEDRTVQPPGTEANFFIGDAASTISQISRVPQLEDATFEWDIAPLPGGPGGQPSVIGQAAFAVFHQSENLDVAREFLAHMTNKENVERLAQFFPPARESVLQSETFVEANEALTRQQMDVVRQSIVNGRVLPSHVNFPQINLQARSEFDALWNADADVEATLEQIEQNLQSLF